MHMHITIVLMMSTGSEVSKKSTLPTSFEFFKGIL